MLGCDLQPSQPEPRAGSPESTERLALRRDLNTTFESRAINDTNVTDAPGTDNAGLTNECIFMTVSGPNIQTWTVSVSYRREGSEIIFEKPIESQDDILNLLPGWTKNAIPS